MAEPTAEVREGVYGRDGNRCVSCGTPLGLSFQHRRAVGMGGSKIRPGYADGVTACLPCNMRYEGDMQTLALLNGWKVRRRITDPALVPYYHAASDAWYVITDCGPWRRQISRAEAMRMMTAAYGPTDPDDTEAAAA